MQKASDKGTLGTIHTSGEKLDDGIYISEKPINDFNFQEILQKTKKHYSKISKGKPFVAQISMKKQRLTYLKSI